MPHSYGERRTTTTILNIVGTRPCKPNSPTTQTSSQPLSLPLWNIHLERERERNDSESKPGVSSPPEESFLPCIEKEGALERISTLYAACTQKIYPTGPHERWRLFTAQECARSFKLSQEYCATGRQRTGPGLRSGSRLMASRLPMVYSGARRSVLSVGEYAPGPG